MFPMNEHVDDDRAVALFQCIDDDAIPQIVRHSVNKPPTVIDQQAYAYDSSTYNRL
jgi:hypothetical protein